MKDESGGCLLNQETEISITDLFYHILRGWRLILICCLIICLLCVTQGAAKNRTLSFSDSEVEAHIAEMAETNAQIKDLQSRIENNQNSLSAEKNDVENSVLLNINPKAKGVANMTLFISLSDEAELSSEERDVLLSSLIRNYTKAARSDELLNFVNSYTGMDFTKEFLLELIGVSAGAGKQTMVISACHHSPKQALEIVYAIQAYYREICSARLQKIHKHTLAVQKTKLETVADETITTLRQKREAHITSLEESIKANRQELYDLALNDLMQKERVNLTQRGVIGLILGVLAGAGWMVADQILHGRVRSASDLITRTNLPVVATVYSNPTQNSRPKRAFSFIDEWIDRLFRRVPQKEVSPETSLAYAAASLHNMVMAENKDQNKYQIACASTVGTEQLQDFYTRMADCLSQPEWQKPEIKLKPLSNLWVSPQDMICLGRSDAVVLVEKTGLSHFSDIERMVGLLNQIKKSIIGVILLD